MDSIDVKDYAVAQLRNLIGYVPQKSFFVHEQLLRILTMDEMVKWLPLNEIKKSGRNRTGKRNLLKRKEGDLSVTCCRGTIFSGGQRQKTYHITSSIPKSDIYIFDDSFSALDFKI